MDKIKTVKIKNPDGSVSEETYTISVDAKDVDMKNGKDLQDTIGNIDIDRDGSIANQLKKYKNYDNDIETLYADIDSLEANDTDLENDIIDLQVNKINKTDIIDNLNSSSNTKVLSAKQGKVLGDAVAALEIENIKKKAYFFDTVAAMKAANLKDGDYACTLGYYSANDGGAAEYKIVSSTNSYKETLNNGLFAELIVNDIINVKQIGAKSDGETDNSNYIQLAINKLIDNRGGIVYFPSGRYFISNTITINNGQKPITLLGETSGDYNENGSQIITNNQYLFKISNPSYNGTVKNLYFINNSSKDNNTFCFSTTASNETVYTARWTFKNLGFRNFTHAINLLEYTPNNYTDGILIENVRFSTVSRCMTFKHLEASKITNCYAEPFIDYFLYVYQSQGFSLEDSVIRGPLPQSQDGCIGVILIGSTVSKTAPVVRNCLFEDVDCAFVNGMEYLNVINSRYTISFTPKLNPVFIMNNGGVNPSKTIFQNFIINYEDSFEKEKIYITSSSSSFIWKDLLFAYSAVQKFILETDGYSDYTIANINMTNRQWVKKGKALLFGINPNIRIFYGDNSTITEPLAPDGSEWKLGDIVLISTIPTGVNRHNHIIGWYYVETGYQTNSFIPIQIGITKIATSQAASMTGAYIGQQSFNSSNNKPIWWNGSKWLYADGTQV